MKKTSFSVLKRQRTLCHSLFKSLCLLNYVICQLFFYCRGYTGPGGIGEGFPSAFNCSGGMAGYIDRIALGNHLYRFPTIKVIHQL